MEASNITATQLGIFMGCLAALFIIANQGWELIGRFRQKPDARDVQQEAMKSFATKEELDRIEGMFEKKFDDANGVRRRMHEQIDDLSKQMSGMQSSMISLAKQIEVLDAKLTSLLLKQK
jgi:glutaredoxin 2